MIYYGLYGFAQGLFQVGGISCALALPLGFHSVDWTVLLKSVHNPQKIEPGISLLNLPLCHPIL